MKKLFKSIAMFAVCVPVLSGCVKPDLVTVSRWKYSKDEMNQFFVYEAETYMQGNSIFMTIQEDFPIFSKDVTENDIISFNQDEILADLSSGKIKDDYVTYRDMQAHPVKILSISNDEMRKSLTLEFDAEGGFEHRALINKEVCGGFAHMLVKEKPMRSYLEQTEKEQLFYEIDYLHSEGAQMDSMKKAFDLIGNIAAIVVGAATKQACSAVGGIFGVLSTLTSIFGSIGQLTLQDVMNKLNEMDNKLNDIQATLEKNHNQLMDETVRTHADVDKVLLNQYEQDITAFYTDYINKIEDKKRNLGDYVAGRFKSIVNDGTYTVSLPYLHDSNGTKLLGEQEKAKATFTSTYTITNFTNSKAFLTKTDGRVVDGFMDEFHKDVKASIEGQTKSEYLDYETLSKDIVYKFSELNTQSYFADPSRYSEAQDTRNLIINFEKRIAGLNGRSIVTSFIERLRYMYNFMGESRENETHILANLLFKLDEYAAFAQTACIYSGISDAGDLQDAYKTGRELITGLFKNTEKLKDGYCFATQETMEGTFNKVYWTATFPKKGNYPTFESYLNIESVAVTGSNMWPTFKSVDLKNTSYIGQTSHLRIAARWRLMAELGLTSETKYIEYLKSANVIPENAYRGYELLKMKSYISDDARRFMTGVSVRDLNSSDKGMEMWCSEKGGKEGSNYFEVGKQYSYGKSISEKYWTGRIAESVIMDGDTGETQSNKKLAAFGRYKEEHDLWTNDEHWAFMDNPNGNYFFALVHSN